MNDIEQKFFSAYLEMEEITKDDECCILIPSKQIDIYIVDFLYDNCVVIEIDGHEYHKTKEQRFKDYQRERYLIKQGYIVIRFMATEVFINPYKCVDEMFEIGIIFDEQKSNCFAKGLEAGREVK